MTEKSSEPISKMVLSGVLTAVIFSILGVIWGFIPPAWHWLLRLSTGVWTHLTGYLTLPLWLLYIMGAAVLGWLGVFFIMILENHRRPVEPTVLDYQEDHFFDVVWRWRYVAGKAENAWPYCPKCDTVLVYATEQQRYSFGSGDPKTTFICETCDTTRLERPGYKDDTVNMVYRQIDRITRNGEWRNKLTRKQEVDDM
jgi:hypothetical protein